MEPPTVSRANRATSRLVALAGSGLAVATGAFVWFAQANSLGEATGGTILLLGASILIAAAGVADALASVRAR